jgi:parvulin-like peptidyl-prolyl isomerase
MCVHSLVKIIIASLLVVLTACSPTNSANDPAATQANTNTAAQTTGQNANPVVARVNDQDITRTEFDAEMTRRRRDETITDMVALQQVVLDALIEQRLVADAAAGMGITITDDEVTAEIQALQQALGQTSDWNSYLEMNGYTAQEMHEAQRNVLLTQRVQEVLFADLTGAVNQVHARHIVVRTEADAVNLLNRLQQGADFAQLASEFSIDLTTRDRGGDLGWFTSDELLDKRLADVAFSLQPGAIAGPISTRIGYHIIQTLEIAERPVEPERMALLMRNIYMTWLEAQFQTATIERYLQ